ncbi:rhomboid family intramembrane serine protease [bacterium]|nr:rhomboid family intramembrane serine protease [bacterium]
MEPPDRREEQEGKAVEEQQILDPSGRAAAGPKAEVRRRPGAPASVLILLACIAVYFLFYPNPNALIRLTFSPANGPVFPQIFTHMFGHAGPLHLFGNMFVLFFLGTYVERHYGTWRYVVLYIGSGLVAALAQASAAPDGYLLGASGALAGVMAAFVRHFPHERLYVMGILPMPAWLFMLLWLGFNLYYSFGANSGSAMGVAFIAHLAGFIAGMAISLLLVPRRLPVVVR